MNERDIFIAAVQKDASERQAYLDEACGDDTALRHHVLGLLKACADTGSFLESPLLTQSETDEAIGEGPGAIVGAYTLIEKIGEGGFGDVFLAEQQGPVRRKVAFKILKPGMDTRQIVARFETERQLLAIMDHPNIAKVYDGGATPSGRPYFVMELIKGTPITEFCDQNQMTPRQRLELLISVCQAVQHAHQKGVIHRDLKPSNVLVTMHDAKPMVKVIDFGVAKAQGPSLIDRTSCTGFAQLIGTPLYMSPEQAGQSGLDIDTRSDIYSLGVLMYELLTGTTPFDRQRFKRAGIEEIRRIIREEDPPRPSSRLSELHKLAETQTDGPMEPTPPSLLSISAQRQTAPAKLSKLVRGELDWIVMKALEKDRERRYETANSMALDVQRYLADEAVLACPPSFTYRLRKFASRNKAPLFTGALVGLLLMMTSTVLAVSNIRIDHALSEKSEALDKVTGLVGKLQEEQKQTKQALYFHSIALADREWWLSNVDRVEEILDQCPEEYRDWEWHFLKRRCQTNTVLYRTTSQKAVLAMSPNGELLACCVLGGPNQKTVKDWGLRVWNTRSGKEVLKLTTPVGDLKQYSIRQDNRHLAIPTVDDSTGLNKVRILDLETGKEVFHIPAPAPRMAIHAVAYCPFGKELAFATSTGIVSIHDANSGEKKLVFQAHPARISALSYHPDGERLATASADKTARVWNAATGEKIFELSGHTAPVSWITYNIGGHRLATASQDGWRTFDAETGHSLLTLPLDPEFEARRYATSDNISFSGDSRHLLAAGQDRSLRVLNAATGREVFRLPGHSHRVAQVIWGDQQFASWSEDGTLRLWPTGDAVVLPRRLDFAVMSISADAKCVAGRYLFSDPTYNTIDVIDVKNGSSKFKAAAPLKFNSMALTLSSDGRFLSTRTSQKPVGGKTMFSLHVRTTTDVRSENRLLHTSVAPLPAVFRPDSEHLAVADRESHALKTWDAATGKVVFTIHAEVVAAAYSRDGRYLAGICPVSDEQRLVKIWDAASGTEMRVMKVPAVSTALSFSSDGDLLAVGGESTLRLCHVHDDGFTDLSFSEPLRNFALVPNSRRLATWNGGDTVVKIRDLSTGREVLSIRGHDEGVNLASFSNDATLTTVDGKGNVRQFAGRP